MKQMHQVSVRELICFSIHRLSPDGNTFFIVEANIALMLVKYNNLRKAMFIIFQNLEFQSYRQGLTA